MKLLWCALGVVGFLLMGCQSTVTEEVGGAAGQGGQGGTGGQAGDAGAPPGGGGAGGSTPVPGEQSLTFGPISVASGEESTMCIEAKLKNLSLLHAHQIHNTLSEGSHHMIVYRTSNTTEQLTPYACQPFTGTLDPTKGAPLMITQKHDDLLTLPAGVAFSLDPEQMIRLEVHFINPTAATIDVQATTTFIPIADSDFKDEAALLFLGDPDISIPAMSSATLGPVFMPLGNLLPEVADKTTFFALTGHTHQWGTNVTVNLAKDANDPGTPVYDVKSWSWAEPETVSMDPGFSIPATGGFKFSCSWDNKSSSTVNFGESANAEMCFFWAYYYPSQGAHVCFHTEKAPQVGTDFCCPGSPLCKFLN